MKALIVFTVFVMLSQTAWAKRGGQEGHGTGREVKSSGAGPTVGRDPLPGNFIDIPRDSETPSELTAGTILKSSAVIDQADAVDCAVLDEQAREVAQATKYSNHRSEISIEFPESADLVPLSGTAIVVEENLTENFRAARNLTRAADKSVHIRRVNDAIEVASDFGGAEQRTYTLYCR